MEEIENNRIKSKYWKYEKTVYLVGKWAWIIVLIIGIIHILWAIYNIIVLYQVYQLVLSTYGPMIAGAFQVNFFDIWNIIASIILAIFAFFIIKPRFSDKCAEKNWDYLLNDVLMIGSYRIPWMFIWLIICSIFGLGWAGLIIGIPAILLIFAGPKPYRWK